MNAIHVELVGFGQIGRMLFRKWADSSLIRVEKVVDPAFAGKDANELAGISGEPLGIAAEPTPGAEIAVVVTSSRLDAVLPVIRRCVELEMSVVTSCEELFFDRSEAVREVAEFAEKQPRTNLLVRDMKMTGAFYNAGLERLGVTQQEDGTLAVDEEKLAEVLNDADAPGGLDSLKDFTKSALRKANEVQLNPMDYVEKRIVAYKNPTKPHFANPYVTSAYSGMLFNGYM